MDLGVFGAQHAQKAGFPRKLALWIGKAGFSYMESRVYNFTFFSARHIFCIVFVKQFSNFATKMWLLSIPTNFPISSFSERCVNLGV